MGALYRLTLECATPKCRELSEPTDDTLVVLPQCLYAVFDRATAKGLGALNDRTRSSTATTAASVEDAGDCLHFLMVGDSGIRINGAELLWTHKDIDLIFNAGRVAVFQL